MKIYKMDCGCSFLVLEDVIGKKGKTLEFYTSNNLVPPLKLDIANVPTDCKYVWEMLSKGLTKGVFQLESNLGRQWTKKLKPHSVEHLSALGALLRPGCVGGDTPVCTKMLDRNDRNLNCKRLTIRDLYNKFKKNHYLYDKDIVSVNEETNTLFNNVIDNVIYSGEKEVFKPKIKLRKRESLNESKYNLECTSDHKLLTHDRGWIELKDLVIGERIAVINSRKKQREDIKNVKGEKTFRDICFYEYKYECVLCDWKEASLDVNHINENRKSNNDYDNLCFMCPNHHRMYHENKVSKELVLEKRANKKLKNTNHVLWAEYLGSESLGIKDTYDIKVVGPNHNFVAGNFVVHNCLRSIDADTGLSLTELYCERKNGNQPVRYLHEALIPILESTYGVLTYQEQAMAIVQAIAGFNLQEADMLRKAIGKKLPEEMAKVEVMYYEGVKKAGVVNENQAKEIFGWIKESQRYSFNKSHSLSYGINGYWSAYCKAHFPVQFFTSYLRYAKEKADPLTEIRELVNEARLMDIEVVTPDLRSMKKHFFTDGKKVQFGLADVKGIGEAQVDKLRQAVATAEEIYGKKVEDFSWYEFLVLVSPNVNSTTVERLIDVGAVEYMK